MCDRFLLHAESNDLSERFRITRTLAYYAHRKNRLPNEPIAAIIQKDQVRTLDEFRWGLMPFWAPDSIQADIYSLFSKRAFDYLVKRQRCIIPGNSYEQVIRTNGKKERSTRFMMPDGQPFAIAGVYDVWNSSSGDELRTCTMITRTVYNDSTGREEQAPILLDEQQIEKWLDPAMFDKTAIVQWLDKIKLPQLHRITMSSLDRKSDRDEENTGAVAVRPRIAKP